MAGVELVLSGTAKVYCVHDREKRLIKDPDDCVRVALRAGVAIVHHAKFQTCGCCENVFATSSDIPKLCYQCNGSLRHKQGGPLNDPIEGVL